jgi:hypothetical protein
MKFITTFGVLIIVMLSMAKIATPQTKTNPAHKAVHNYMLATFYSRGIAYRPLAWSDADSTNINAVYILHKYELIDRGRKYPFFDVFVIRNDSVITYYPYKAN